MRKRALGILVTLLLVACVFAACSPQSTTAPSTTSATAATTSAAVTKTTTSAPTTAAQQYGGTLRIITNASALVLGDPLQIRLSFVSIGAIIPCLEALLVFDNSGQPHGVLAESWTVAADSKSITFKLRQGVKFHDGTPFNATAAKWNLDRMLSGNVSTTVQWSSIEKVDDYTIRLNLKAFANTILNGLEGTTGLMVSPTAAEKNGLEWLKMNPVGTGPYKFKSFVRDTSCEYERFEDYWGGRPYLDGVKFIVIADATTAQMTFQAGQADVLSASDSAAADLMSKGYTIEKRPGTIMVLFPDSIHPTSPFSDIRVRQAVSYAIDNAALSKALGYGFWEPATQLCTSQQAGYIETTGYAYNPAKAKELLAAAGFPNGFQTRIITSSTLVQDPLQSIQNYLKAVGIDVKIDVASYASWTDQGMKGWDNALIWITLGATDTNYGSFLDRYFGAATVLYPVTKKPDGLQDLIKQLLTTSDYNTQKTMSKQAVKILQDDCTAMPVYISSACYVLQKNVHDTGFNQLGGAGFRWSVQKAWMSK